MGALPHQDCVWGGQIYDKRESHQYKINNKMSARIHYFYKHKGEIPLEAFSEMKWRGTGLPLQGISVSWGKA